MDFLLSYLYNRSMNKILINNYRLFKDRKQTKSTLKRHFESFLPEVIYRTTRMENPKVTRKQINAFLSS